MTSTVPHTIVKYLGENDSSCGYCKSTGNSSRCYGMWAYTITVADYQSLIDRGWRRSGSYCYKPNMRFTCCVLYTIRCGALEFNISKSQKKVIKKVNNYVEADKGKISSSECCHNFTAPKEGDIHATDGHPAKEQLKKQLKPKGTMSSSIATESLLSEQTQNSVGACSSARKDSDHVDSACTGKEYEAQKRDVPCNTVSEQTKSGPLRRQHKGIRLAKDECNEEEVGIKLREKTLEEFLCKGLSSDSKHKLMIRLVRCSPASVECDQTTEESYELYRKYQIAVHNSSSDDCTFHQYKTFLVNSPLQAWKPQHGPPEGYGSFHQQYWLDEKLIAVGVIDILPKCISSVYFFYDPDFAFLSLGTYGALREIATVRFIHQQVSSVEFYYMGYYIDLCPKMQYKANYKPSYMLCPEVYTWHPFEECKRNLQQQRYSRFNPDISAADDECNVNTDEVLILYKHMAIPYAIYKHIKGHTTENEDNEVLQYAKLVGRSRSKSMLLYRADN